MPVASNGRVVIELDVDDAEWLVGELPHNDGFTRDLHDAIALAHQQIADKAALDAELPQISIRVVMR